MPRHTIARIDLGVGRPTGIEASALTAAAGRVQKQHLMQGCDVDLPQPRETPGAGPSARTSGCGVPEAGDVKVRGV